MTKSSEDFAWLAGLLEGEAAMNIVPNLGTYVPALLLHMTDRDIIDAVRPYFGNPAVVTTDRPSRQRRFTIRCKRQAVLSMLPKVIPFMRSRSKARQAELVLEFQRHIAKHGNPRKRGHPEDVLEARRVMWEEYRLVNGSVRRKR